jgi:ubiquinone/menaquinone biosynthesis C-methylase UbiE
MVEGKSHEALVGDQFGSSAEAYLKSAVHARGADLEAIVNLTAGMSEARVLDLGCGGGHVSFNVAPHVREVVAYDLSREMLQVVARSAVERGLSNVITREGVAEKVPFDDESFDMVLSRYSAHHWRDFDAGLREAARVLKPGGVAGFADTVAPPSPLLDTYFQTIEMLRDHSHVRDYSRAEWEAAMARAGLLPVSACYFRVHLDFASWVERMKTPKVFVDAIRALQASVSESVTRYFETKPDGSFSIDVCLFRAMKVGS